MTAYHWWSLFACAGHMALAVLALSRASRDRMATVLGLLALVLFTWNAADLIADFSSSPIWDRIDHTAASFTMPLAFHFLLLFVGEARRLRALIAASYLYYAGVVAATLAFGIGGSTIWAVAIFLVLVPELGLAFWLLGRHLRVGSSVDERARTWLVLLAILVGGIFGTADLMRLLHVPVPRLSNVGTLASVVLLAMGAMRFKLFERNLSWIHALTAASMAIIAVVAYVVAFARFGTDWAGLTLAITAVTIALVLSLRRFLGTLAEERSRREFHGTLGRFAHQMAHDLKNPLAAAKGAVQFLKQERAEGRSIDGQGEFLELLEQQIEQTLRVVSRYQRIARVEAVPDFVDLNQVVEQVVASMRHTGGPVEIAAELAPDLEPCRADRDLLINALENLIRNGLDAIDRSGRIVVRTLRETRGSRPGISVSVEDDGRGMSPRIREQALDDFFTTKASGSGLGLAFVRRVVDAHAGEVSLASEEGRGTVVSLWLPMRVG